MDVLQYSVEPIFVFLLQQILGSGAQAKQAATMKAAKN
jgi:hypothetical protein